MFLQGASVVEPAGRKTKKHAVAFGDHLFHTNSYRIVGRRGDVCQGIAALAPITGSTTVQ